MADLSNNPIVQHALEAAWLDSQANDPALRHEEGGWIYLHLASGDVLIRRAPRGRRSSIYLDQPPVLAGAVVVGKFHSHPNPTAQGWLPGPSAADTRNAIRHGVPSLIRADDGVHTTGPDSRGGGLSGNPGYPA